MRFQQFAFSLEGAAALATRLTEHASNTRA